MPRTRRNGNSNDAKKPELPDDLPDIAIPPEALERILDAARCDHGWRSALERAVGRSTLSAGSSPKNVWQHGTLLQKRFLEAGDGLKGMLLLALSCPRAREQHDSGERIGTKEVRRLIDSDGPPVAAACAYGALIDKRLKSLKALWLALETLDGPAAADAEPEDVPAEPTPTPDEPNSRDDEKRHLRHDLKLVQRELGAAKKQISQLTKKNAVLERELAETRVSAQAASDERRKLAATHGDAEREIRSLREHVAELQKGKKTLEERLARQAEGFEQERRELAQRIEAAEKAARLEKERAEALERGLEDERRRREQVEALIEETGFVRLLEGLRGLEDAIATLETLRTGLAGYQQRLEAEEQRRNEEMMELQEKSRAAHEARRKQEEIEAAWRQRESERLAGLEQSIFGKTPPDVVLIDGHNVIIPAFGKVAEKERRQWLLDNVRRMSEHLARQHPQIRVVLCFDTQFGEDRTVEGPNLVVHYCRNDGAGEGADAAIQSYIETGNPDARYLVFSSDRKHVWAGALDARAQRDSRVSLAEGGALIEYFAALDRIEAAAG